ncbi:31897_t:CDS:1, partial [Racocetra persica]
FIIGVLVYIHILNSVGTDHDEPPQGKDEDIDYSPDGIKKPKEKSGMTTKMELERAGIIAKFCSDLVFCLIAGPSTLWVKAYLLLAFLWYSVGDLHKKLETKDETEKISKQEQQIESTKA